jgi:protein TonB
MINSEFNLYKREWLSLVFKNRNQQYGAYELRSHYTNVLSRAMAVTFFTVAAFGITATVISRSKPPVEARQPIVDVIIVPPKDNTIHEAKKIEPVKKQQTVEPAKAALPVNVQKFVVMRPTAEPIIEEPKPIDASMAVGSVEVKVAGGEVTQNVPASGTGEGKGTGTTPGIDDTPYDSSSGLEFMPEPVGGEKPGKNSWKRIYATQ